MILPQLDRLPYPLPPVLPIHRGFFCFLTPTPSA